MKNRNIKQSDNWETPEYFYDPLHKKFNFDFDPCPLSTEKDEEGNLIKIWDSIIEITRTIGFNNSNISKCCRGFYKTMNGYRWEFVEC